jgi:peptidoglycan/xylan/chitin deacetylase (PgdA/CDA1 family)
MAKHGDAEAGRRAGSITRRVLLVSGGGLALGALYAARPGRPESHEAGRVSLTGARAEPRPSASGTRGTGDAIRRPVPADTVATPRPTVSSRPSAPRPAASKRGGSGRTRPGGEETPMWYVDDGPKVIALTIDDGPSPVYTPQILAVLARYKITAAFSMVGENVRYYPGVAREVASAGHMIVNHTWDHANLASLGAARTRAEIDQAAAGIHAATGVVPRMFRAPYGVWTPTALEYCARERLTPLDWSVDPRDWSRPGVPAIVNTIMATTRTGSIILEHDGGGDRSQTVSALKIAIPRLLDEGYRFSVP